MSGNAVTAKSRYGWVWPVLGVVVAIVCMIVPIVWVGTAFVIADEAAGASGAGTLAALGVMFRGSARTVMRASVTSTARVASRSALRKTVRVLAVAWVGALVGRLAPGLVSKDQEIRRPGLALFLGFGGLTLSCAGVLALTEPATRERVLSGANPWLVSALAASPIFLHYGLMRLACRTMDVTGSIATRFDGLLLQAYFTGAGSFLPMTSDVELQGTTEAKANAASLILLGLSGVALLIGFVGDATGQGVLTTASGMLLLYAFVFSFPIMPLEGGLVWSHSRLRWLLLWSFVTFVFMVRLPEEFYGIL